MNFLVEGYANDDLIEDTDKILNEANIVVHFQTDPDFVMDNYGAFEELGKFTESDKIKGKFDIFEITMDKSNLQKLENLVGKESILKK